MESGQITLDNLEKLHQIFRCYRSHDGLGSWFRGQSDSDWELVPKAGRKEFYLQENKDLGRFNVWRRQAIAYCSLPQNELEQLAIAQHHGLATRLLDWTMNPLVACYFACYEQPDKSGAVFIYEPDRMQFLNNSNTHSLKDLNGVFAYIPHAISPRVLNQKALFSVHCDAQHQLPIEPSYFDSSTPNLIKILIPAALKKEVIKLLDDYGINRTTLFPDLDGLSAHINQKTSYLIDSLPLSLRPPTSQS